MKRLNFALTGLLISFLSAGMTQIASANDDVNRCPHEIAQLQSYEDAWTKWQNRGDQLCINLAHACAENGSLQRTNGCVAHVRALALYAPEPIRSNAARVISQYDASATIVVTEACAADDDPAHADNGGLLKSCG